MTRPDLDAIRARAQSVETDSSARACDALMAYDALSLLAYIDELESRVTYAVGETEWAHRIAVAEQRAEEARDEARAQLAAVDTGSPCDGHRHCCADRRRLAEELLRVRAERDALRSSLDRKIRHCDEITEERDALKGKP